ncbi:GspH/FimT family protein [Pseudomonas fulva]|nr:GspH/FimT family pseudopilin [Pseudomonas fulva]MBF8781954.1 GspH/FimT family protein [Pseudomonas fulva]
MRQHGATLIQTMLALAVTTILAQLGSSAYAELSDDLHAAACARELAQALRLARSHALLHEQTVQVRALEQDWSQGWRVQAMHDSQVLREQQLACRSKIVGTAQREIRFSAQGVPLGGHAALRNGTLHICRRGQPDSRYQVVWASSGRVSLRTERLAEPRCAGA